MHRVCIDFDVNLSLRLVSSKWLNRWLRKSQQIFPNCPGLECRLYGRFDWGQQVRNNFDVSARSTDFGSLDNVAIAVIMLKLRVRTTAAQQANYMAFACATMSLVVQFLHFPKDLMNHSHVHKCQDWFRLRMFCLQAGLVPRLLHRILPPQVPSHLLPGALQERLEATVSRDKQQPK